MENKFGLTSIKFDYILKKMTHWHSPHFHAYFPTANSYPSICADMLSGALACIGFTWVGTSLSIKYYSFQQYFILSFI